MCRYATRLARARFLHGSAAGAHDVSIVAAPAPTPVPTAPAARLDLQPVVSARGHTIDDGLGCVLE